MPQIGAAVVVGGSDPNESQKLKRVMRKPKRLDQRSAKILRKAPASTRKVAHVSEVGPPDWGSSPAISTLTVDWEPQSAGQPSVHSRTGHASSFKTFHWTN